MLIWKKIHCTVKPRFMDTHFITHSLPLPGKESLYIFSKFNSLNTDTFYGPLSVRINRI